MSFQICAQVWWAWIALMILATLPSQVTGHHLCDCFESTQPLHSCLKLTALTRNESHLVLIEDDDLYWVPTSNVFLKSSDRRGGGGGRLYMINPDGSRIQPVGKWYNVAPPMTDAFRHHLQSDKGIDLNTSLTLIYHGQMRQHNGALIHDTVLLGKPNATTLIKRRAQGFKDDQQIWARWMDVTDGERPVVEPFWGGIPVRARNITEYGTIGNGRAEMQGFAVEVNFAKRNWFYPLRAAFFMDNPEPPYLLKNYNATHAIFLPDDPNVKHGGAEMFSELLRSMPFGFLRLGHIIMWDVTAEEVLVFPYTDPPWVKGGGSKVFAYERLPLRQYVQCRTGSGALAPAAAPGGGTGVTSRKKEYLIEWSTTQWLACGGVFVGVLLLVLFGGCWCMNRRRRLRRNELTNMLFRPSGSNSASYSNSYSASRSRGKRGASSYSGEDDDSGSGSGRGNHSIKQKKQKKGQLKDGKKVAGSGMASGTAVHYMKPKRKPAATGLKQMKGASKKKQTRPPTPQPKRLPLTSKTTKHRKF